jgi:hypothetical protein
MTVMGGVAAIKGTLRAAANARFMGHLVYLRAQTGTP